MASNPKEHNFFTSTAGSLVGGLIIGIVIGLGSGVLLGRGTNNQNPSTSQTAQEIDKYAKISPFFADHSAIIQGKIKSVNSTTLTVEHMNGKTVDVALNNPIYISEAPQRTPPNPPSTDIKDLEIGLNALVNLKEVAGEFKVFTVTLLPNLKTPLPFPSPKASTNP